MLGNGSPEDPAASGASDVVVRLAIFDWKVARAMPLAVTTAAAATTPAIVKAGIRARDLIRQTPMTRRNTEPPQGYRSVTASPIGERGLRAIHSTHSVASHHKE